MGEGDILAGIMSNFIAACANGSENVKPYALGLLAALATIELSLLALLNTLDEGENIFHFVTKKVLKYGFYIWLIQNWASITKEIFEFFKMMGMKAAGTTFKYNLDLIAEQGITLAHSIFESVYALSMHSMGSIILNIILGILVFVCFAVISIFMFVTEIQFHIIATLSTVLLAFGVNKFTSFLSEKVIGAIFSLGIKIMALNFVLCLTMDSLMALKIANPDAVTIGSVLRILIVGAAGLYLTINAPSLASDLLSGSPSLGDGVAGSMARGASNAGNMAKGAVTGGVSTAMGAYGMVQAAANAPGGRSGGGNVSLGGTARNLGSILRQQMPDRQAQTRGKWAYENSEKLKKEREAREANKRQTTLDF